MHRLYFEIIGAFFRIWLLKLVILNDRTPHATPIWVGCGPRSGSTPIGIIRWRTASDPTPTGSWCRSGSSLTYSSTYIRIQPTPDLDRESNAQDVSVIMYGPFTLWSSLLRFDTDMIKWWKLVTKMLSSQSNDNQVSMYVIAIWYLPVYWKL